MRTIRVGVAGLGTVGRETVRLLAANRAEFRRRLGAELRLEAVCDRDASREAKALGLPAGVRRLKRPMELLALPLDVVVEALGGLEDAEELALGALRSGRHVATANKRLVAHRWPRLFEASRRTGARLAFEASVAGGIPILAALRQGLAANRVRRVLGILNGTTNFILSRMARGESGFREALSGARKLGLAERDASADLEGVDAAHKAAIIASLLTGRWFRPKAVARQGILDVEPQDLEFAAHTLGRALRLLAVIEIGWSARPVRVSAFVAPTLVPLEHPLASVHEEYNAVLLECSAAGDLMFYGKGAGPGPAASAVVGDVFMLAQAALSGRPSTPSWTQGPPIRVVLPGEDRAPFYLRLSVADRPGALARIAGALGRNGISISRIHQEGRRRAPRVPVFITTHPTRRDSMGRALRSILGLPEVAGAHACFRMLES